MNIQSTMPKVPFIPSSMETVDIMVELSGAKPGQKVADLGAGDGRIVMAFAKKGVEVHGYEIDADLALKTASKIKEEGLDDKIFIHHADYWQEPLSQYDIITIYGMTSIMGKLEEKLKRELKHGAKIVSNTFTFPTWEPVDKKKNVYLYIVP